MIDYWSKLKLDECWSKKERYNKIMNFLLGNEDTQSKTDDPTIEEEKFSNISVLVTDNDNNPINQATVTISGDTEYTGVTGTAGGCTIKNVLFGDYEIVTTAEGFVTDVDTVNVNSESMSLEIMLVEDEDPNSPTGTGGTMVEEDGEF